MRRVSVAITGEFSIDRNEVIELLEECGLKFTNSLKANTSALLVGNKGKENKIIEAELFNIPVIYSGNNFIRKIYDEKPHDQNEILEILSSFIPKPDTTDDCRTISRRVSASPCKRRRSSTSNVETLYPNKKRVKTPSKSSVVKSSEEVQTKSKTPLINFDNERYDVVIDGIIGVGKSYICKALQEIYPHKSEIYSEEGNEALIELFNTNPSKYGFALQYATVKSFVNRIDQCANYEKDPEMLGLKIWDGHLITNYAFALQNYLMNGLTREEMDVYEKVIGGSILNVSDLPYFLGIDMFVLLTDEPSLCKSRTESNINTDTTIPLYYYEGLDDVYFYFYKKLIRSENFNVVIQTGDAYSSQSLSKSILLRKSSKLIVDECDKPLLLRDDDLVYSNEEQIVSSYKLIINGTASQSLSKYKNVYLPKNIMTVQPSERCLNEEKCKEYDITLYKNEYKRVVLWHLSQSHNVYFYNIEEM